MNHDHSLYVRDFVLRIMAGEHMDSPEDLQFYLNNRVEIEELLKVYSNDSSIFEGSE